MKCEHNCSSRALSLVTSWPRHVGLTFMICLLKIDFEITCRRDCVRALQSIITCRILTSKSKQTSCNLLHKLFVLNISVASLRRKTFQWKKLASVVRWKFVALAFHPITHYPTAQTQLWVERYHILIVLNPQTSKDLTEIQLSRFSSSTITMRWRQEIASIWLNSMARLLRNGSSRSIRS